MQEVRARLDERNARAQDLSVLAELVTTGWRGIDQRLARIEERLAHDGGAPVYRVDSRQAS